MRIMLPLLTLCLVTGARGAFAQAYECPTDVGAAVAAACPCEGNVLSVGPRNHGKYVSCVVRLRNDLRRHGCLTLEAQRTIARCAARSTCGKAGAVLCCRYDTSGTCNDPLPGDNVVAGVCSNDGTRACDTAVGCITAGAAKISRYAATCTDSGGTVVGTGSTCTACPLPPPAP